MFNFFVTGRLGAWDHGFFEIERRRFLEYTEPKFEIAFTKLEEAHIATLRSWPCLFAYEGESHDVFIGTLTSIKVRSRTLFVEFTLDVNHQPIPFVEIRKLASPLDIREWEMNRTHWAIKDADLISVLRDHELIEPAAIPVGLAVGLSVADLPEAPPPPTAATVEEFISQVLALDSGSKEVFYRGHSNKDKYQLEPSLFRKDAHGNYIYLHAEHMLYQELLVSNSVDFQGDNYTLDRLVRMQHYSLPTRLLDITSNPLIALYFACKSNPLDTGEVIVMAIKRERIKYFDSDTASCIANLARLSQADKEAIDHGADDLDAFNSQPVLKRLLHFVKEEKSFFEPRILSEHLRSIVCVKGKRSNNRISFQSGAFLLFGLDAKLAESGNEDITVTRIVVSAKEELLRQLDLLNINESTVFPYIENSAKYVAKKYSFNAAEAQPPVG